MGRISLTPEDMQAGQPIEDAWYKAEIIEAVQAPSKEKDSINYIPTFRLENYRDGNVTVKKYFNSKAMSFNGFTEFLAALAGKSLKEFVDENPKGVDFEWEQVKGGKLQIKVKMSMSKQQKPFPDAIDFAPYNYTIPF